MSDCFTDVSMRYVPFLFGMIDLPLQSPNVPQGFKSDGKRGIVITATSNAVLFKKEIKEGEC